MSLVGLLITVGALSGSCGVLLGRWVERRGHSKSFTTVFPIHPPARPLFRSRR